MRSGRLRLLLLLLHLERLKGATEETVGTTEDIDTMGRGQR